MSAVGYTEFVDTAFGHVAGPLRDARTVLRKASNPRHAENFLSIRRFGFDTAQGPQVVEIAAGPVFTNYGARQVPSCRIRVTITLPSWPNPEEWGPQLRLEASSRLRVPLDDVTFERDAHGVPRRLAVLLPRKRQ